MLSFDQIEHGRQKEMERGGSRLSVADRNRAVMAADRVLSKQEPVTLAQELQRANDFDRSIVAARKEKSLGDAFSVVQEILDIDIATKPSGHRVQAQIAAKVRNPLWELLLEMMTKNNLTLGDEKMVEARKEVGIRTQPIEV